MQSTGRAIDDAVVYQIYTYSAAGANSEQMNNQIYLIGQLAVSKQYGNIVIKHHKLISTGVKGLKKVQTESADFNKKFDVFATSQEQATSFELLTPTMMATLINAPFEINIEVIDRIIYFYAPLKSTDASHYASMLSILQTAYRELKL